MDIGETITEPTQVVYMAGRNVATFTPWVVPLVRVFHARPDAWLMPWELWAWGTLPDAVAEQWFLLGADCPWPNRKPLPFLIGEAGSNVAG